MIKNRKILLITFIVSLVIVFAYKGLNMSENDKVLECDFLSNKLSLYTQKSHLIMDFENSNYNFKRGINKLPIVGEFIEIENVDIETIDGRNILTLNFSSKFNFEHYGWRTYTYGFVSDKCKKMIFGINTKMGQPPFIETNKRQALIEKL